MENNIKSINEFTEEENKSNSTEFDEDIFKHLPRFYQEIVSKFQSKQDRDAALITSIGAISGLLPNYYSIYDRRLIEANLYIFLLSQFGEGKGLLGFIRKLVQPTDDMKADIYEKEMKKFLNSKNEDHPKRLLILMPANTTKTNLLDVISENNGRLTFIESEADTLSDAMNGTFGAFGDILRNGLQGEPSSYTRLTDKVLVKINRTTITTVISGTHDQLPRLFKNYGNGLGSRFEFLEMETNPNFNDVLSDDDNSYEEWFLEQGQLLTELYSNLHNRSDDNLFFRWSEKLFFQDYWRQMKGFYHDEEGGRYNGLINRQALKCAKIAMGLAVIREYFDKGNTDLSKEIICSVEDMYCAMSMSTSLLRSNIKVAQFLTKSSSHADSVNKKLEEAAQIEAAIKMWDEGLHNYAEIGRRLGIDPKNRNKVMRWLHSAGRK